MTGAVEFIRKIRKSGNETFVLIPKPLADGFLKEYSSVKVFYEDWTDEKTNETVKCIVLVPIEITKLGRKNEI